MTLLDENLFHTVALHSVLELEVAIRHAWLYHRADLETLREVRTRADELAEDVPMTDAGELLANTFFEAIELRCSPRHLLAEYSWMNDDEFRASDIVLRKLWDERRRRVFAIDATLPAAQQFRLGDLSWENDLPDLLHWCIFMATAQPHEIGPQERVDEDGKKYITHITVSMPARVPRRRAYDNFYIYDADVDEVIVNGQRLRGKMMLMVDAERQIDNFPDIIDAFGGSLGSKQAWANWQGLQNGILPTIESLSVYDHNRRLARQRDSFEVRPRSDRPENMLKGLICWDLHKINKMKIEQACDEVGLILSCGREHLPEVVKNGIRTNYDRARKQIEAGKLLPWSELTARSKPRKSS
jgi:hypothetical protein